MVDSVFQTSEGILEAFQEPGWPCVEGLLGMDRLKKNLKENLLIPICQVLIMLDLDWSSKVCKLKFKASLKHSTEPESSPNSP